jgi:DNA topoisomerase-3
MRDSTEHFDVLSVPCPKCGGEVCHDDKGFRCRKCDFSLPGICAGRSWEAGEVEQLIAEGHIGPVRGFRSLKGQPFAAVLRLDENFTLAFQFEPRG